MIVENSKDTDRCPRCESTKIKFKKTLKDKTKCYYCNNCHKFFSTELKLVPQMMYSAEMYDYVIQLSHEGLSSPKIYKILTEIYNLYPCESTVRCWIQQSKRNKKWIKAYTHYNRIK